jgi:uncharacterized membrane protein YphA (DoxX/SURF4 family)
LPPPPAARTGNAARKIPLRFVLCYLVLFFLPEELSRVPWLKNAIEGAWHSLVVWVGARVLHIVITTFSNGSGDTTYDYVKVATIAVLAASAALLWAWLDDRGRSDARVYAWVRVGLRYTLAYAMLRYGFQKVFPLQFGYLSYADLTEPLGELSPMSLLWNFMAFSPAYTCFGGLAEVTGGALLLFRRTTTLGALVVFGVMANVVALNFCYDVPVKIFSTHLLCVAAFLAAPDARRLANVFLFNRATAPAEIEPEPSSARRRWAARALKLGLVGLFLYTSFVRSYQMNRAQSAPPIAPDGPYEVASFVRDGQEAADVATDRPRRWKIFVLKQGYVRLWFADRETEVFKVNGDPVSGTFDLVPCSDYGAIAKDATTAGTLRLTVSPGGSATITGTFLGHDLLVAMNERSAKDTPLMKRGFHWINEEPYQR